MRIFLVILELLSSLVLISSVILQSGKSAGLSGSITGGSEAIFGSKKKGLDSLLSKVTAIDAAIFLIISLILSLRY
ncbi:MAG: preprotein translocase subunit SecG [Syntrophomonadaceae bacterium]|jgi:preprotein translocase subunit SecG|nr:preprotein translocase subunit SecG [Syntrophomonadaceae bacterium]